MTPHVRKSAPWALSICALGIAVHAIDLLPRWEPPDELYWIREPHLAPGVSASGGPLPPGYAERGVLPDMLVDTEFRPLPQPVAHSLAMGFHGVHVERSWLVRVTGRPKWLEWLSDFEDYSYTSGRWALTEVEDGVVYHVLTRDRGEGE